MTRIEVTETELSLLHDLLEADRHQARAALRPLTAKTSAIRFRIVHPLVVGADQVQPLVGA